MQDGLPFWTPGPFSLCPPCTGAPEPSLEPGHVRAKQNHQQRPVEAPGKWACCCVLACAGVCWRVLVCVSQVNPGPHLQRCCYSGPHPSPSHLSVCSLWGTEGVQQTPSSAQAPAFGAGGT